MLLIGDLEREPLTGTERAVLGPWSVAEARSFLSDYARDHLGSPVADVTLRAGRIDVVWGVGLADGRQVAIKVHRLPADLEAVRAAVDATRLLRTTDYPCADPLSGPDEVDGHVLTAESLLVGGAAPDGQDPTLRRLLADGLAEHVARLRGRPDLADRAGPGPSWCRYQQGPWPVPHDPIVDFRVTPDGYGWLDDLARRAADQVLTHRVGLETVVGHADWYAGNTAVTDGVLTATFDWELVADAEAVIAGFTAACFAASSTSGAGLSTPEDAVTFLRDYEEARARPFTPDEQRASAGATAWILAFNARWQVGLDRHEDETLALVRARQDDYLTLAW